MYLGFAQAGFYKVEDLVLGYAQQTYTVYYSKHVDFSPLQLNLNTFQSL